MLFFNSDLRVFTSARFIAMAVPLVSAAEIENATSFAYWLPSPQMALTSVCSRACGGSCLSMDACTSSFKERSSFRAFSDSAAAAAASRRPLVEEVYSGSDSSGVADSISAHSYLFAIVFASFY